MTLHTRSGKVVNEVSPSKASDPRRRRLKLEAPAARSQRHKRQGGGFKADPGVQAFHEAVALGQGFEGIGHFAIEPAVVPGVGRHFHAVTGIHDAVEQMGAHPLGPAFGPTIGNHAVHHVVAALPQIVHFGQQVQRVLKVAINQHHGIAPGVVDARRQGRFFAEIARQGQVAQGQAAVRHQLHGHGVRGVGAAVIDDDDFKVGRKLRHRFGQRRDKAGQVHRFVKRWHHAGQAQRRARQGGGGAAGVYSA